MGAKIIEPPSNKELRESVNGSPAVRRGESVQPELVGDATSRAATTETVVAPGPPKSLVREYFESAVVTIIMALFGMTFIVQAVKVPTGSMQNTINIGDQLLVNKFIFAPGASLPFLPQREIRRGDVIVFKYPGNPKDPKRDSEPDNIPFRTNYVKRVVGMPGEVVEVYGEKVLINGRELPERRVTAENFEDDPRTPYEEEMNKPLAPLADPPPSGDGAYTVYYSPETRLATADRERAGRNDITWSEGRPFAVPAGHYFVMGDNRDNSADSRVWGVVARELVVGRAMMVYWSYDMSAPTGGNPIGNFLRNTRWDRTGTMIK